jgi:hypothetical protein
MPRVLEAAKDLDNIAARIFLEGFNAHQMPTAHFFEGDDNVLTRQFRDLCKTLTETESAPASGYESSGLQQLAEIARNLQPLETSPRHIDGQNPYRGYAANGPHCDQLHTGQTLPLPGARQGGAPDAGFHTAAWHGLAPGLEATNEQSGFYGQTMQAQLRPYSEQTWPPQPARSRNPSTNQAAGANDYQLGFGSQSSGVATIDNPMASAQDHTIESSVGFWDEFVVNDFAGSLHCLQD